MDQQTALRMTLLALEETVRAVASKGNQPSSSIIGQINAPGLGKVTGRGFSRFFVHRLTP
jgi:hypothetical protein